MPKFSSGAIWNRWGRSGCFRQPIVFVHVPKTAGQAVTRFLSQHCPSATSVAPPFVGNYSMFTRPGRWSVIAGHFTYSRMRHLVPQGHFITFLRDPVARAVSQFKSWKDPAKMTPEWRSVMSRDEQRLFAWIYEASFAEFVANDHPAIVRALSNSMATFLSSDGTADAHSAFDNLRTRFTAFGIQERFDDSIQILRSACPWLGPYRVPPVAENRSRVVVDEITPATRRRIEDLNDADLPLYREATALFQERVAAAVAPMCRAA